ncbi:MAG TPA: hypothetical protein VL994_14115, partial [Steroidobacteraceae bacterium]|nr:hypothetical protein [Steroidobacteraceae bacterium]
ARVAARNSRSRRRCPAACFTSIAATVLFIAGGHPSRARHPHIPGLRRLPQARQPPDRIAREEFPNASGVYRDDA